MQATMMQFWLNLDNEKIWETLGRKALFCGVETCDLNCDGFAV